MSCKFEIHTGSSIWSCPREESEWGYCDLHKPKGLFVIRYYWYDGKNKGKTRFRTESGLATERKDATRYTFEEACDIVVNKSKDASIFSVKASKEHIG